MSYHFGYHEYRMDAADCPICAVAQAERTGMSYIVIAKSPEGGAWLESTHQRREDAETEAERLNRLPLPFRYVVVERKS